MSRKFRWFLLAACAFVLVANAREAIEALAGGPQLVRSAAPAKDAPVVLERKSPRKSSHPRRLEPESELARGGERRH